MVVEPEIDDGENPEWTLADFARARPAREVLGDEVVDAWVAAQKRRRGAQKAPTKTPVSLRLSASVVDHFRATGPGWQRRIDEALKAAIDRKIA